MTPQERYTKARSIPPSEWDKANIATHPIKHVLASKAELQIELDHSDFITLFINGEGARVVGRVNHISRGELIEALESFIDHYAPEVELVWDVTFAHAERYEATVVGHKFSIVVRLNETRGLWEWWMYGGSEGMAMKCGYDHEKLPAISAAKAAARELIKSVLKPG